MSYQEITTMLVPCTYCGAKKGEACAITLVPEVGPLSVPWNHSTREQAAS